MMIIIQGKLQDEKDESRLRDLEEGTRSARANNSLNIGRNEKLQTVKLNEPEQLEIEQMSHPRDLLNKENYGQNVMDFDLTDEKALPHSFAESLFSHQKNSKPCEKCA